MRAFEIQEYEDIDIPSTVKIGVMPAVGQVMAPPSKSVSHRMLICAALAQGESVLRGLAFSEDILATMRVMTALGAHLEIIDGADDTGATVRVRGCGGVISNEARELLCNESGSTLRFAIPLCLLRHSSSVLRGSERLLSRPLQAYNALFPTRVGVSEVTGDHSGIVEVKEGNSLAGGKYQLPGDVSSQFISGLLFALPLCRGEDSTIKLTSSPQSKPYIDMTLDALHRFGVRAAWTSDMELSVPSGQQYCPYEGRVEEDASNAAFFEALNYLGSHVTLVGLNPDSLQGDRVYAELFEQLAKPRMAGEALPQIDLADCPDLAPILFAMAAETGGAVFTHTDRLRLKECDRIAAMQKELAKFGARIEAIDGYETLEAAACGGIVRVLPTALHAPMEELHGHNDHRVVMSLSVLATKYGATICGAEAVRKSFPDFFVRLASLGADIQY